MRKALCKSVFSWVLLWCACGNLGARGTEPLDNFIYDPAVRSVQFHRMGNPLSFPMLTLGGGSRLELHFDELRDPPTADYGVTFVHCNADWTPSDLIFSEFFDGISQDRLLTVRHSQGTQVSYNHYRYVFPNEQQRFKVSGNYVLKIFRGTDEEDLVLTRRFVITENKVQLRTNLGLSNTSGERFRLQAVNFELLPLNLPIQDPNSDFKIQILQNFRWDNRRMVGAPTNIWPGRLEYIFDAATEFNGGNEFRLFDSRNTLQAGFGVQEIQLGPDYMRCFLRPDRRRTSNAYLTEPDLNGAFIPGVRNMPDPEVSADYMNTYFRLLLPAPLERPVYVFGQLTDWKLSEGYRMRWNPQGYYETEALLKQGVYNYIYVVDNGGPHPDETALEGTHAETENYYTILVYWRRFGGRYDELIALRHVNFYE